MPGVVAAKGKRSLEVWYSLVLEEMELFGHIVVKVEEEKKSC